MNQIYLPKNSSSKGMTPGQYVVINIITDSIQASNKQTRFKPYFYGIKKIEPIKLEIIEKIFAIVSNFIKKEENIIITGSFIDEGFSFNDIDILILSADINTKGVEAEIIAKIGIKPHVLSMAKEELARGLASDPLYQTMISRCISKNKLIFNYRPQINSKFLDLHLLKSKTLIDNFETLNGKEKYYLTFNMISILLFLQHGKITKSLVEKTIKQDFDIQTLEELKDNLVTKEFLIKYKNIYNKTFDLIMENLKHESK